MSNTIRYATKAFAPEEALRLAEDIQSLTRILYELRWLDPRNVDKDEAEGRRILRNMQGQIKMAERHARSCLQEYLAPQRKRVQAK